MNLDIIKRIPLLSCIVMCLIGNYTIQAKTISPEDAAIEAADFLSHNPAAANIMRAPLSEESLSLAFTAEKSGSPLYYIFNHDSGFIIVSADTRFSTILGYSDSGKFEVTKIPANMKEWLEGYSKEITHYSSILPESVEGSKLARAASKRTPISPLITTKWDQTSPYNLLCPTDNKGNLCVTGCVATAYAQIMKFHEWPRTPEGSNGGIDFDGTVYSWRNMLDEYVNGKYTSIQATAVATLMRQCGAAVNMMYSAWASGAYSFQVPVALTKYFKYADDLKMLWKDYTPQKEWSAIIYGELAAGRPVYYSGASSQGGHAFVCDGYSDDDYFHFNWGWGGYEDGYFLLSALNPASGGAGSYEGGYNSQQSIVINIHPGTKSSMPSQVALIANGGVFHTSGNNYEVQSLSGDMAMIYNPLGYPSTVEIALEVTPADKPEEKRYVNCGSPIELNSLFGFQGFSSSTMPSLADGDYKIRTVYKAPGVMDEWQRVAIPIGMQDYVELKVSGGVLTYNNPGPDKETVANLIFGNPEFASINYSNMPVAVRIPVVNVGKGDFFGNIGLSLTNIDDEFANVGSSFTYYSIPSETASNIEATFYESLPAGRYILSITDMNGNEYADDVVVTIEETDFKAPEGDVIVSEISPSFITSGSPSPLNFTIGNSNFVTTKVNVGFEVLNAANLTSIKRLPPEMTYNIPGNESIRMVISPFDYGLEPGEYYIRAVDGEGKPLSYPSPLIVNSSICVKGNISYVVTSESRKEAVIVSPEGDSYTGSVAVPSAIDGYKVVALRNDAFTFSDVRSVTLPASIKSLAPGTFYADSNLNYLHLLSEDVIPYKENIFLPGNESKIWLDLPSSIVNQWMNSAGWNQFRSPSWQFLLEDGVEILTGLDINPDSGSPYNPYYVNHDMPLLFSAKTPGNKNIRVLVVLNGEWIQYEVIDPTSTSINLPAMGYFSSGRVVLSATDESVSVKSTFSEPDKVTVYSIDGRIVAKEVDKKEVRMLNPGLYIIEGKKVVIK